MTAVDRSESDREAGDTLDPGRSAELVIWALRRCPVDRDGVAVELRRLFGVAGGKRVERVVAKAANVLGDLGGPWSAARAGTGFSHGERLVVVALAAHQRGDAQSFGTAVAALAPAATAAPVAEALSMLAGGLDGAGCRVVGCPIAHEHIARQSAIAAAVTLDPAARIDDLTRPELVLVRSMRHLVMRLKIGVTEADDLEASLRQVGVADAVPSMVMFLRILGQAASRIIDIRLCRCPFLSPDEARFLQVAASLQRGDQASASALLEDWLPPQARAMAIQPGYGIALAFLNGGFSLPWRSRPAPQHERAPSPMSANAPRSVTLH